MKPNQTAPCCFQQSNGILVPRRNRISAFTLVEVMISTAILAVLVVILSQVLIHVSGIWEQGHAQVEKSEGGRAILESMAKELQSALLPANRTAQTSLQFVVNPQEITDQYKPGDKVFWQAPLATDATRGDIAEIGYFVRWDNANTQNPRARLCRFFINPSTGDVLNPNFKIYTDPTAWISDDIVDDVSPANNIDPASPYEGLFVENVIGLWVTCLDPAGNTITRDAVGAELPARYFDSRRGYSYVDIIGQPTIMHGCALPAAVDLSFVMLDNNSANRMTEGLRDAFIALASDTNIKDANDFVTAALKNPVFTAVRSGLRPCMTRVYLQNSK